MPTNTKRKIKEGQMVCPCCDKAESVLQDFSPRGGSAQFQKCPAGHIFRGVLVGNERVLTLVEAPDNCCPKGSVSTWPQSVEEHIMPPQLFVVRQQYKVIREEVFQRHMLKGPEAVGFVSRPLAVGTVVTYLGIGSDDYHEVEAGDVRGALCRRMNGNSFAPASVSSLGPL